MKTVLPIIAVLCAGGYAWGGLVTQIDPGVDLGEGLYSYTVRLVADAEDDKATAWEGSFDGPMNQNLYLGVVSTPSMTYASLLPTYDRARDSHFLHYDADLFILDAPNENAGYMGESVGYKSNITALDFPLAQVVVPAGQTVNMAGQASDGFGNKVTTQATIIGGQGGLAASFSGGEDTDGDGILEVSPGTQVYVQKSTTFDYEPLFVVTRKYYSEVFGRIINPYVGRFRGTEFTFEVTEPGEYAIQEVIVGGLMPDPFMVQFETVPEPATLGLLALGGLALLRRRRCR